MKQLNPLTFDKSGTRDGHRDLRPKIVTEPEPEPEPELTEPELTEAELAELAEKKKPAAKPALAKE